MYKERISRKKFIIRLGAVLGANAATASVLAACGGGQSGGGQAGNSEQATQASGSEQNTADQAAGPSVSRGETIAQASEVPDNSAKAFTAADTGQPAVLVHLESGDFVAYSSVCTHRACLVNYQPQTQKLACPCHGSVFDPAHGAAVDQGPAKIPLPPIDIAVQNGEVILS